MDQHGVPFREVFWNIHNYYVFYIIAAAAVIVCLGGLILRFQNWRSGWLDKRDGGFDWRLVAARVFLNASILRGDAIGGITHLLIMWGFLVLFLGTVMSTIDHWLVHYLKGDLYLGYAWVLDIAGVALVAGIVLAYLRRYLFKREKMITVVRDHVALGLLAFIAVTGFMVEGLRLVASPPPWREPSPVGWWVGGLFGLAGGGAEGAHRLWWWLHSIASLAFIAYVPFSKFIHVFAAPVNLALEGMRTQSQLALEEREKVTSDFSCRQVLMTDACTQCNRCTVVCPSAGAREPLSPRECVQEAGSFLRRKLGFPALPWRRSVKADMKKAAAMAGERIWYCTTCSHCYRECPVAVSAMDLIREVRTARIESGEDVPDNIQEMLESVYKFRNPWQGAKGKRLDWVGGLSVPVYADGARSSRCFYVGCTPAYDARMQEASRATATIFGAAKLPYAVLGKEEQCCGELIRGVGEEGLFAELVSQNAALFARYGIEELVTGCPHGYHTFRNDYPRAEESMRSVRVRHVAEVLEELVRSGTLRLEGKGEVVATYHDSCFLGRWNGVYDAPRAVLRSIPGLRLVEMERSRERSFCCGGGGGRMWVEASEGEKIAEVRVREAAATGATVVVTACPFCLANLDDASKTAGFEDRLVVKDLAEMVAAALPGAKSPA